MKAIQYRSYGGYSENRFVDLPQPPFKDNEVLVAMHTVGINPLDNTFRSGPPLWGDAGKSPPHRRSDGCGRSGREQERYLQGRRSSAC